MNTADDDVAPETRSVESRIGQFFNEAQETLRERCAECEAQVRKSPTQALLVAAGIGYVLNRLPLGTIVAALIRLILVLLRPAAILFCAVKVYDLLKEKQQKPEPAPVTPTAPPEPAPPF